MSTASGSVEWQRGAIAPPHRPPYSSYDSPPRPYADSVPPREMRSPYGYAAPPPHVVSRGSAPPPHGPPHDYWYDGQSPSHRRPGGWYHRHHDAHPSYDHRPQMAPPPPLPPQSYYHSMSSRDRPYAPDVRPGRVPSMREGPPPSSHPHSLQPRRVYGTPKRKESNSWSPSRGGGEKKEGKDGQDGRYNHDARDSRHTKDMMDSKNVKDRKNGDPLSLLAKVSSAMAHDGKKKSTRGNQEEEDVDEETDSPAPSSPDQRRGPRPTKVITPTGSAVQPVMARQISPMVDPRRHHEAYYDSGERNPGPSSSYYPPPQYPPHYGSEWGQGADLSGPAVVERGSFDSHDVHPPPEHPHHPPRYEHSTRGGSLPPPPPYYPYPNDHSVSSRSQAPHWVPTRKERLPPPIHGPPPPRWQQHHHDHQRPPYLPPPPSRRFDHRGGGADSPSPPSTPYKKHQHHGDSMYAPYTYVQQPHLEEKTVLRKKFSWKHYPELERFLIANRDEYLKHSSMNYTAEQKQYNNWLTEKLLEVASEHHYAFDPEDFNFVAIRDRIRCYYKSYVQTARKRGLSLPSENTKGNKKLKRDSENDSSVAEAIEKEATTLEETSQEDTSTDEDVAPSSSVVAPADVEQGTN